MHEALEKAEAKRIFWHIQMKPGMPTLFSVYQDTPIISLSGNPFGVAVSVDLLIRPVLQKMMQDETLKTTRKKCVLKNDFCKFYYETEKTTDSGSKRSEKFRKDNINYEAFARIKKKRIGSGGY